MSVRAYWLLINTEGFDTGRVIHKYLWLVFHIYQIIESFPIITGSFQIFILVVHKPDHRTVLQ